MPVCPSYEKLSEVLDECELARLGGRVVLGVEDVEAIVKDLIRCRLALSRVRVPAVSTGIKDEP